MWHCRGERLPRMNGQILRPLQTRLTPHHLIHRLVLALVPMTITAAFPALIFNDICVLDTFLPSLAHL
jgi:hypothetical protein